MLNSCPILFQEKTAGGWGATAVLSLVKDEFLAPHCYGREGTNPLVLTGDKENAAKITESRERNVFQHSFREEFNPFRYSLPITDVHASG